MPTLIPMRKVHLIVMSAHGASPAGIFAWEYNSPSDLGRRGLKNILRLLHGSAPVLLETERDGNGTVAARWGFLERIAETCSLFVCST